MVLSCETWLIIFGALLSVFLRCTTTLHPHSGMHRPPMYGDYEAQRHWMEITTNLPIGQWYHNGTDNDLEYWGLDYPPLTAYHMYLCGKVAHFLNKNYTTLYESRGYESDEHKVFMRYTVLVADIFLYVPAIILYYCTTHTDNKHERVLSQSLSIILSLLYPGIILIDHGHFQYNCVSLALLIYATIFLIKRKNILASICFCLALNYKQMELYHSLPFFLYLLSTCVPKPGQNWYNGVFKLAKIATTVLVTFVIIWWPFFGDFEGLLQVLHRQFPLARGVFEDKVSNVWCALNVIFKFKTKFCNYTMMRICLFATLSAIFPSSADLFLRPNVKKFVLALINSSLAFFLFSFQVHEKSILLVAIPVLLHFSRAPFVCFWFLTMSIFSMLPLLIKDGLVTATISLTIFYAVSFRVSIEHAYRNVLNHNDCFGVYYSKFVRILLNLDHKNGPKNLLKQIAKNTEAIRKFFFHLTMGISLFGCVVLTLATLVLEPPARYPDLFPLLISVYSCVHFIGFFIYFNVQQLKIPQQFEDVRYVKVKES